MIKTTLTKFFFLIISLSMYSCQSYYYYPTNQNVLKFKEKGDASVSFGLDENGANSYNIGYSITDNVALLSDFRTFDSYSSGSSVEYKIDDYLWDTELIFYKKYKDVIYPAINVGYGFGEIDRNERHYKLNVNRQFIQPSIGISNNFYDFAISSRFSRVNYDLSKVQTFYENVDLQDVGKKDFYFVEPAFTLGIGYKFIKFRYQGIFLSKISSGKIKYCESSRFLTLNMTFNINKLFVKDKN